MLYVCVIYTYIIRMYNIYIYTDCITAFRVFYSQNEEGSGEIEVVPSVSSPLPSSHYILNLRVVDFLTFVVVKTGDRPLLSYRPRDPSRFCRNPSLPSRGSGSLVSLSLVSNLKAPVLFFRLHLSLYLRTDLLPTRKGGDELRKTL